MTITDFVQGLGEAINDSECEIILCDLDDQNESSPFRRNRIALILRRGNNTYGFDVAIASHALGCKEAIEAKKHIIASQWKNMKHEIRNRQTEGQQ